MKTTNVLKKTLIKAPLALAIAASATATSAYEYNNGDLNMTLSNTLGYGIAIRTEDRDEGQIMPGNADSFENLEGLGSSYNYDDGTLNYDQYDIYTHAVKLTTDLEVTYRNYGGFFRTRLFYDDAIMNGDPKFKDFNEETEDAAGLGYDLLDAFIYSDFDIGDIPVSLRLGRQVLSWGESTFIQGGIASINPLDATAFRKPGVEVKELLIPVGMAYVSAGLTADLSFEAYYQYEWDKTRIDQCGTFFSTVDFVADGCGPVILGGTNDEREILRARDGEIDEGRPLSERVQPITERLEDQEPRDDGQYGASFRLYTDINDGTEFGLYYLRYHSRLPFINGYLTNQDRAGYLTQDGVENRQVNPDAEFDTYRPLYQIEYPEDLDLFGLSFATTTPGGLSIGGEISYRPDFPIQWNAFELVLAGNLAPESRLLQRRLELAGGLEDANGNLNPNVIDLFGNLSKGYDRYDVYQAQTTMITFIDRVLGADQFRGAVEFGVNYIADLPDTDTHRYGRSGAYGIGNNDGVDPFADPSIDFCSADTRDLPGARGTVTNDGKNANPANCTDDGYVTQWAGGVRARGGLFYNNAFKGINLIPNFAFGYDIGNGPEPGAQFIDERLALTVGLAAEYGNSLVGTISYTNFSGGKYNVVKDRDNLALAVTYSF